MERVPPGRESDARTEFVSVPVPLPKALRQDIEILRILSAFGIVWFHSGFDRTGLGYSGLVVFLVLSSYFPAARKGFAPAGFLASRAVRLLTPWAFWMAVYAVRNHLVGRRILEIDRGWLNGLLAGTQIHLWYLPFIFAVTVGLEWGVPRARRAWLAIGAALGAIALLVAAPWWRPWVNEYGYPSVQYFHAIAGVLAGIFFGSAQHVDKIWRRVLVAAMFAAAGFSFWQGVVGVGQTYLVALPLCAWILLRPPTPPSWLDVRTVSECMFGVYLVHIVFDRMYFEFHRIPELVQPWLTFGTSLLLVWLLRRFLPRIARYVT